MALERVADLNKGRGAARKGTGGTQGGNKHARGTSKGQLRETAGNYEKCEKLSKITKTCAKLWTSIPRPLLQQPWDAWTPTGAQEDLCQADWGPSRRPHITAHCTRMVHGRGLPPNRSNSLASQHRAPTQAPSKRPKADALHLAGANQ